MTAANFIGMKARKSQVDPLIGNHSGLLVRQ